MKYPLGTKASPSAFSIPRLLGALRCSLAGLAAAWRGEAAFRLELTLAVVLLPLAFWLGRSGVERALLAGSVLLVLVTELLNSSLESAVNCAVSHHAPGAGRAKDLGSAAVMGAVLAAGVIWIAVLF